MDRDYNEQIINPANEEEKAEVKDEANEEAKEEIIEVVNEEINSQPVCESEKESGDSFIENSETGEPITEDKDWKKNPESTTLKTGDYIIKVNKAGTDYLNLLEEMYNLKNNTELSGKEKNDRLKDILSKNTR